MLNQIVLYSKNLANARAGVDKDGAWGYQCADLSCFIVKNWCDVDLWGNAIDLLNSAEAQGIKVVTYAPGIKPKAGWIFVMHYVAGDGIDYGHTGVIVEDSDGNSMRTVEQNLAGNLNVGSPAQYHVRSMNGMVGFIVLADSPASSEPAKQIETGRIAETGVFTLNSTAINVRRQPHLSGEIVATYQIGESVTYDSYLTAAGYRWISWIGRSGKRSYMAIGQVDANGRRISLWGTLK
ncbi:CHAP domain-containing protein [Streptococcus suis]|uniref:CHAP domain-containing protein n=2 Tax=Streptococcus suis TaxID=1307 RepID=UPI000CF46489|nr:CHAP domain-containing protein [Streptococcus suis]HEL2246022.1 SH3 domain-containing protein [Streptococcus suis]HEL2598912.1 SH3 domain-containing protein [Streptococcus suis]